MNASMKTNKTTSVEQIIWLKIGKVFQSLKPKNH